MGMLAEKIEEIRQKPEHIRIRYVWGCVAASMVLIISIWIFSITAMFKNDAPQQGIDGLNDLKTQLQNINQQAPSIKDIGNQIQGAQNEGVNVQNSQLNDVGDLQYPLDDNIDSGGNDSNSEIPQSSAYSTDN